jgi:hypothetical protein
MVAQNICTWNIVVIRFWEHCLWCQVTTFVWMNFNTVSCLRGHGPLTNGSSATRCPLQITSNAALLHFPEFKFRHNKSNLFMLYATEYRGWWMWLQHFERTQNFTDCAILYPRYYVWGDAFENIFCSTGKQTFFLTDQPQTNRQHKLAQVVQSLTPSHSVVIAKQCDQRNNSDSMRKNSSKSTKD